MGTNLGSWNRTEVPLCQLKNGSSMALLEQLRILHNRKKIKIPMIWKFFEIVLLYYSWFNKGVDYF